MRLTKEGLAIIDADSHAGKWVEEQGRLDYDPTARVLLAPLLRPGDTAIDVGANIGAYTVVFLDAVGPSGMVYAFEPNMRAFECLTHNCPRAKSYPYGISDHPSVATIHAHPEMPRNIGAFYLEPDISGSIECFGLDYLLGDVRPRLIKIDVEGMECAVLRGAQRMISVSRPYLFIEVNKPVLERGGSSAAELYALLEEYRYVRKWPEPLADAPQVDILFEPKP